MLILNIAKGTLELSVGSKSFSPFVHRAVEMSPSKEVSESSETCPTACLMVTGFKWSPTRHMLHSLADSEQCRVTEKRDTGGAFLHLMDVSALLLKPLRR